MGMGEHDELRFAMERFGLQDFFDERHYAHMTLREVQVGDILSRQNFDLDSLYFLLEGDVRFFRFSGSGKMMVLGFGHGPSMIGEVELVLHKPTVAFTELMTDGTVVEMPMDYCRQAMSDDTDIPFLTETLWRSTAVTVTLSSLGPHTLARDQRIVIFSATQR